MPGDQLRIICQLQSNLGKLLGIDAVILDEEGKEVASGKMLVSKNED